MSDRSPKSKTLQRSSALLTLAVLIAILLAPLINAKDNNRDSAKENTEPKRIAYARLGEQIRQNKVNVGNIYSVSDKDGRFHNIHADKLLMDCTHCHGLKTYKADYLLVSKYKKLPAGHKGRVEKVVCLGCHLPGGMGAVLSTIQATIQAKGKLMSENDQLRSQTYRLFAGLLSQAISAPQWGALVAWAKQNNTLAKPNDTLAKPNKSSGFLSSLQLWILDNALLDEAEIQILAIDFTRLFTGIAEEYGPPPPYEHLYRQDFESSSCKAAVSHCYTNSHLRPQDPYYNASDHIVAELHYMALLASEASDVKTGITPQRRFLGGHLLTWVPQWQRLVEAQPGQRGFYPEVTEALVCFLQQDLDFLSEGESTA